MNELKTGAKEETNKPVQKQLKNKLEQSKKPDCETNQPWSDHYDNLSNLFDELTCIDMAVSSRVKEWRQSHASTDFLGLYISEAEVDSLLARQPQVSNGLGVEIEGVRKLIYERKQKALQLGVKFRLDKFRRLLNLTQFEVDTVLLALASELDSRYSKLFAYLQDDVTKKKPTVGLILSVFRISKENAVDTRKFFNYNSPLIKNLIFHMDDAEDASFLERALKLDDRIVGFLVGSDELDQKVVSFARLSKPETTIDDLAVPEDFKQQLIKLSDSSFQANPVYHIRGSSGAAEVAEAFCGNGRVPLLFADLRRFKLDVFESNLRRLFREAALQDAAVYLDGFDATADEGKVVVLSELNEFKGEVFVPSKTDLNLKRKLIKVTLPNLTFAIRRKIWFTLLDDSQQADEIASKFHFGKGKAVAALESAKAMARMRNAVNPTVTLDDLYSGCKAQSSTVSNAVIITPRYKWQDIVLREDKKEQLLEVCNYIKQYSKVYEVWGFDKHSRGKGLNVLFSGPSGTGKTMAAEIVSGELKLDLYKIDLSLVVSKYIGETEKNLNRIFKDAEECNAVLFFDEADALFGKRSEVKDAHDRYANIEINYLLQKMEEHEGIAILATNMSKSIDDAFLRRMNFIVEFPFPTEEYRLAIWRKVFPEQTPIDKKIDLEFLSKLQVSGGNIKNIALAAAFLAASGVGMVKMEHIVKAARREFEKIGKAYEKEEFGKYYNLIK